MGDVVPAKRWTLVDEILVEKCEGGKVGQIFSPKI